MSMSPLVKVVSVILVCLSTGILIFYVFRSLSAAQNSAVDSVIRDFIVRQASENKAVEYEEARKVIKADLNDDSREDAVVLYTLESFKGTNLHFQYLAVFMSSQNSGLKYVTQEKIGGKNIRAVELESVANGKVNLVTRDYLPDDASCCPSKKGKAEVVLYENKFKVSESN